MLLELARKWVLRLQGSSKFVDATIWSKVPPAKNILLLKVTRCGGAARTHPLTLTRSHAHTHMQPHTPSHTHACTHAPHGRARDRAWHLGWNWIVLPFDIWRQNQNQKSKIDVGRFVAKFCRVQRASNPGYFNSSKIFLHFAEPWSARLFWHPPSPLNFIWFSIAN